MKKKFYSVGTLLYVRNMKCGAGVGAAIIAGVASSAAGAAVGAGINAASTAAVNADNEELTRESWGQQTAWMHEQMHFNNAQAKLARQWQSDENELSRLFADEQAQKAYDFNAQQAQIDRDFQAEQAALARDWNAVDAQMARAKAAGVNPALYAGGNMPTSNITAGGAAASGSPASVPSNGASPAAGVGTPAAGIVPQQVPNLSALSHLGEIGNQVADMKLKDAQAKKLGEETKSVQSFNEFARDLYKNNVDVSKNTAQLLYGKYCESVASLEQIAETCNNLRASTAFMDAQTTGQDIENIYKSDFMAAQINDLNQKANLSKNSATALMYKLPLELGLIKSQQALNYMQGKYLESAKELNYEEVKKVEKISTLLTTQNRQASWNLLMDMLYGKRERQASLEQLEYNSDETVMLLKTISDCLNTVFNGVQASSTAYGAKKIGDNVNLKSQKPTPIGGFGVSR